MLNAWVVLVVCYSRDVKKYGERLQKVYGNMYVGLRQTATKELAGNVSDFLKPWSPNMASKEINDLNSL